MYIPTNTGICTYRVSTEYVRVRVCCTYAFIINDKMSLCYVQYESAETTQILLYYQ